MYINIPFSTEEWQVCDQEDLCDLHTKLSAMATQSVRRADTATEAQAGAHISN